MKAAVLRADVVNSFVDEAPIGFRRRSPNRFARAINRLQRTERKKRF
jgi:hypothetical protein